MEISGSSIFWRVEGQKLLDQPLPMQQFLASETRGNPKYPMCFALIVAAPALHIIPEPLIFSFSPAVLNDDISIVIKKNCIERKYIFILFILANLLLKNQLFSLLLPSCFTTPFFY